MADIKKDKKSLSDIFDGTSPEDIGVVIEDIKCNLPDENTMKRIQYKVLSNLNLIKDTEEAGHSEEYTTHTDDEYVYIKNTDSKNANGKENKNSKFANGKNTNGKNVGDEGIDAKSEDSKKMKRIILKKYGVLAAAFVLIFSVIFGVYSYASENREYHAAVRFFNDHELSSEGLTRGEVKKVYRDIITKKFTYSKTAEVIQKSISNEAADGYEIWQNEPTPEDIENLWNNKNYNGSFLVNHTDESDQWGYRFYHEDKVDEELGLEVFEKSYFEKYEEENLKWRVEISDFQIFGYAIVSDGIIVYGHKPVWNSEQKSDNWLAKIDENGMLVWKVKLDNGFEDEDIRVIIEDRRGDYIVLGSGDYQYLCFSKYDKNGVLKEFRKNYKEDYHARNMIEMDGGYIVQMEDIDDNCELIKLDLDGNVTETLVFDSEDSDYYIRDMVEYGGKIYLSGYAAPKLSQNVMAYGGRNEIAHILHYLYENDILEISSEKLTPIVRENYTAILLIYDFKSDKTQEFYSVKGSMGGELKLVQVQDFSKTLVWETESITNVSFYPAANSFTLIGTSYIYRYTFDSQGTLISQKKTEEIVEYKR